MPSWSLSLRPAPESALTPVDVVVDAHGTATVRDLAEALGSHLAPDRAGVLVVPVDASGPWPAERALAECALRTGDLLDVVTVPRSWRDRPAATAPVRAVVRVVSGPDAGRTMSIRTRSMTIGRSASSTVRLGDPLVSTRHARLTFDGLPMIVDEGSANGTRVDGEDVVRATRVAWGSRVSVGGTDLLVESPAGHENTTGGALVETGGDASAVSVFRSPRFGAPLRDEELEVPAPPTKQKPSPLPWAMLLLPMLMGGAMFAGSRNAYSLVYMLGWPVLGLAGWWQQKRSARKEFEKELALWRTDVDDVLGQLDEARVAQRARAEGDHPDVVDLPLRLALADTAPGTRTDHPGLWDVRPGAPEFLDVRVGRGPVPALLRAEVKDGGDREQRAIATSQVAARSELPDLPVVGDLSGSAVLAVVGGPGDVDAAVRALVLRLVVAHSPADLTVAAVLGADRTHHESWLRWLPHVSTRIGGEPPVAVGAKDGQRLLDHLLAEDGSAAAGHTLCLVDEGAGLQRRNVEAVAARALEAGLHLVWLGSTPSTVPAATDLLLDTQEQALARRDRGGRDPLLRVDGLELHGAWRAARVLTSRVDEAAVRPPDTAIPSLVRLPDVSPDLRDADDVAGVLHRWSTSTGLRAQIGCGVDGVVSLDLREDGPHGLVAGTTGSGKSELLQSLIASLAVNNPPERITFLLVDYKGGAAFRECADLPHTVGYITDLTPALVHRALSSLNADITRREALLAEFGVKDLVQLEREFPQAAPPSLLICVDEFAALTSEVPDFVDGMVNIAQRGRSLGMHVLLATQRPAGVVTPAIRANADLRIALRVGAEDDSRDVIDSADAARISRRTPGRAWIRRTGHGTADLVQAAWLGAREPLAAERRAVTVGPFSAALPTVAGASSSGDLEQRLDPRTDLERVVTTVTEAFRRTGAPAPRKPWLPPLATEQLVDPHETVDAAPTRRPGQVPVGRVDEPAGQRQPELVLDYAQVGHVLVHGASGSGKSELLRSLAVQVSLTDAHGPVGVAPYVYGLDFAGGGLAVLGDLPTVGGIIPESQTGRVLRLIRVLKKSVDERSQALAATGAADLDGLVAHGHRLPRVHLLVDNLPALLEMLESGGSLRRSHADLLGAILQNGRRVGVHVTATAPGRTGVPSSLGSAFGRRVILRMTSQDDYLMLGVPHGILDAESPAGAALLGKHPAQLSTIGGAGTPDQVERLAAVSALLAPAVEGRSRAEVPSMPGLVPASALPDPARAAVAVGVDAETVSVVSADLLAGPLLLAGRGRSGRTTALRGFARLARRSDAPPTTIVYAGPTTPTIPATPATSPLLAGCAASGGSDGLDSLHDPQGAHVVGGATGGGGGGGAPYRLVGVPEGAYDVMLGTAEALRDWVAQWQATLAERAPGEWALLLVDDAHVWDRDADSSPTLREAVTALVAALAHPAALGLALVVAGDTDDARTRQLSPGLVQTARRGRRGMLFAPEGVDGSVFSVTVPLHATEPMTGPGRALWCVDGQASLVQAVADEGSP